VGANKGLVGIFKDLECYQCLLPSPSSTNVRGGRVNQVSARGFYWMWWCYPCWLG